jgi:tRNA(Ile)-lysidine synthase
MSSIIKERNDDYFELINNKYNELIDSEIEIKKLKKIPNSVVRDILRFSIKKSNLSLPNTKIMNEIIKTFLKSSPGPKSIVSWSRSDREELAGQITFKNGFLIISKDNRRNDES